jgi:hypothetical protein
MSGPECTCYWEIIDDVCTVSLLHRAVNTLPIWGTADNAAWQVCQYKICLHAKYVMFSYECISYEIVADACMTSSPLYNMPAWQICYISYECISYLDNRSALWDMHMVSLLVCLSTHLVVYRHNMFLTLRSVFAASLTCWGMKSMLHSKCASVKN